jgi:hypothetical protein
LIKIRRKKGYSDSLRKYKIILDNNYLGDINEGEINSFEVAPGKHTIYLKIDWCRSNKLDFYISENDLIELECGSSLRGWRFFFALIYITFLKNKYLWIKTIDKFN